MEHRVMKKVWQTFCREASFVDFMERLVAMR